MNAYQDPSSDTPLSRRQAIAGAGAALAGAATASLFPRPAGAAGSPVAGSSGNRRPTPREELVNTQEFAGEAAKVLPPETFSLLSGGDRTLFDRITLRPRIFSPTLDMDLGVELFGREHFAPILLAPIAKQRRFHPEGEIATARAAAAARSLMIVSSHSSVPLDRIAKESGPFFWFQVYADDPTAGDQAAAAIDAGAAAIVATVGALPAADGLGRPTPRAIRWNAVASLRRRVNVPFLVKGVITAVQATEALRSGANGMIASNYGGLVGDGNAMILALPEIVDAAGEAVPILVDGAFRRGTDILKALALGARAVLIGRPAMWGLAAYGADGVQSVIAMLQTELARSIGMSGRSTISQLDRSLVRIHGPLPAGTRMSPDPADRLSVRRIPHGIA